MYYKAIKNEYTKVSVCMVQLPIRSVSVIITLTFVVFRNSILIRKENISLALQGRVGWHNV